MLYDEFEVHTQALFVGGLVFFVSFIPWWASLLCAIVLGVMMTAEQVRQLIEALSPRERLIARLAILAGMRPGEIFALTWRRLVEASAEVTQRVYRGKIDTPKTHTSVRQAVLTDSLSGAIEEPHQGSVRSTHDLKIAPAQPNLR